MRLCASVSSNLQRGPRRPSRPALLSPAPFPFSQNNVPREFHRARTVRRAPYNTGVRQASIHSTALPHLHPTPFSRTVQHERGVQLTKHDSDYEYAGGCETRFQEGEHNARDQCCEEHLRFADHLGIGGAAIIRQIDDQALFFSPTVRSVDTRRPMDALVLPFLVQCVFSGLLTVAAQRSPPHQPDDNLERPSSLPPVALLPFAVGIIFFGLLICTRCWGPIRQGWSRTWRANKPLPPVPREYWHLPPIPRTYWRLPPLPRPYWRLPALPTEYTHLPPLPPDEESSIGSVPPYESVPRHNGRPAAYFEPPPYNPA
ncbi:hypothetical protein K438DRAFT_1994063 [Mycena galopus ATCC 62051]|nr:hypothetical protein K438DRAFT_1994063 [Mycena galopus ATCC 62051]